ncbi:heparan sulfate glucosamine 3-O-sulfotransferase 5-like [Anneissia japonica]|uniref:heparan sulfate glucosamine 3-O-sulfotransferase 5-like n=1 Tax=Anneissia japonica TaxID=1529436 RepID=UPI0014259EFB|nr:heparan sulfate glucosamine 3-O-sulfotransferase 5-like [Anneissia japonica]XP_033112675.1 heparan sulfate glucosamine 3-O-sulfotransferase 5-like [Anneissia japonica]
MITMKVASILARKASTLFVILVTVVLLGIVYYRSSPNIRLRNDVESEQSEPSSNEGFCKYCYTSGFGTPRKALPRKQLRQSGCEQRLPDALIIGVKKCGTGTLTHFISFHPQIAPVRETLHYFVTDYFKGLDWYKSQMPYALRNQTVLDKSPGYISPQTCDKIRKDLPSDVRIIAILRDPVARAVSDFVHIHAVLENAKKSGSGAYEKDVASLGKGYDLVSSLEDSLIDANGNVRIENGIITKGIYVNKLRYWFKQYPRDQILLIDGNDLNKNPYKVMQTMEKFLGLQTYFTEKHFYFNPVKRFYCLARPINECMVESKGRSHPVLSQNITNKLQDFFKPFDRKLEELTGQKFSWVRRN